MANNITLLLATEKDAELIYQMQYESFFSVYEKKHDDETKPIKEKIDNVVWKNTHPDSEYYLVQIDGENVGAVRVKRNSKQSELNCRERIAWISPIFILPKFQNRGITQEVIRRVFELYPDTITWRLATIKQETGNCHLYEKCGFIRTGKEHIVNESMTLIDFQKANVGIRRFEDKDAETYDAAKVKNIASYAHMYVFEWKGEIVGVGSISSFWGSKTESILLTIFVKPELQGLGIGRTIIRTLEQDVLFTRAVRIEIPASITGVDFYRKLGYDFKNGVKELDEEHHYRLERFRE